MTRTVYRSCTLCEATCGLKLEVDGDRIVSVRGDEDDVFSHGESRVHRGPVRVQVNDDIAPGVVSLPHGWGHAESATWQRVAGAHPGVSANDWTDDGDVEAVVGQSILNGVPVRLAPAA